MNGAGWINVHASALVLGDRGLLLRGPSGSGKSTLAVALIEDWRARGHFARLVSDDRIDLRACGRRLLARAPEPLAGLCEVHGLGPHRVRYEPRAIIDLAISMQPEPRAPRYQDGTIEIIHGCSVPVLRVPERNTRAAVHAVLALLERMRQAHGDDFGSFDLPGGPDDLGLSTPCASTR